jgi:cytochrome b
MNRSQSQVVWDVPTRLAHWAVAFSVVLNLFVLESGDPPHKWAGYTAAGFVCFRLFWGMITRSPSRLKNFPLHPKLMLEFIKNGFQDVKEHTRHNPGAAWTYIFIWVLILCLAISGFMMGLDRFWGEEWLEELHEIFSKALELLLIVHLVGLALDSLRHRRPAWMAMIHGRK